MISSIQHFIENGVPNLQKASKKFSDNPKDSPIRKVKWEVVRTDKKNMITSIGKVTFLKTLFKNKETGERRYLLDDMLHFDPHERMSKEKDYEFLNLAHNPFSLKKGV